MPPETYFSWLEDLPAEVIGLICSYLSCRHLEEVRLLSKAWRDIVDNTLSMQRQRFLLPALPTERQDIYFWKDGNFSPGQGSAKAIAHYRRPQADEATELKAMPITALHHFLDCIDEDMYEKTGLAFVFDMSLEDLLSLPEGGEWERTFLSQPPTKKMKVIIMDSWHELHEDTSLDEDIDFDIKAEGGLTFGRVVEELRKRMFPQQIRARAAKKAVPRFDLDKYWQIFGEINDVVLADGEKIAQAIAHEEWEAEARAKEAAAGAAAHGVEAGAVTVGRRVSVKESAYARDEAVIGRHGTSKKLQMSKQ